MTETMGWGNTEQVLGTTGCADMINRCREHETLSHREKLHLGSYLKCVNAFSWQAFFFILGVKLLHENNFFFHPSKCFCKLLIIVTLGAKSDFQSLKRKIPEETK